MKINKILKNKKGASMLDYFILSMVSLLIGSAVFAMGGEVKKGIGLSKDRVAKINANLEKP